MSAPAPNAQGTAPAQKNKTRRAIWIFTAVIIVSGIIWFFLWLFYLRFHQFTDDAYVNGYLVNINAAVPGSVVAFYADDTDLVKEGQLLVELDASRYRFMYEQELAALAVVVLDVKQLYDDVLVNAMNVETKKAILSRARYDHDNRAKLLDSLAISHEDFVHSKDDLLVSEYQLRQAEEQLQMAKDAAGNTPLISHPRIEKQKAKVRESFYDLKHTRIYAPVTGYVAKRNVNVGQWVANTTNMMAVIPEESVWVDANYKETQLTYMRIGQPAVVWFDLYGSRVKYTGKVLGIASGSGSVFSLIPPQNATGNWIKIVQRLPVRISIDQETLKKYPARIGISAEVDVDIARQDLPMLAQVPPEKPVAVTDVFRLDFKEIDQIIDDLINKTLEQHQDHHEST